MGKNSWKEHFLKSGIPLEYEVKKFLDTKACLSNFDYSYLRRDEDRIENEFSYDIDSSYFKPGNFIELMIECKYRDESTNWIFIPEEYFGYGEIGYNSFMHPNDHFTQQHKFMFKCDWPDALAPLCSKGVEIFSSGNNNKTITQAVSQLSYAMAEKYVGGMSAQVDRSLTTSEIIFYHIPIIVTTAKLFLMRREVNIKTIKTTGYLHQIADEVDCLVFKNTIGQDLKQFNLQIFQCFISQYGKDTLNKKIKSFNKDIAFVSSVISEHYCPETIVIINHSENNTGFEKLFSHIDGVLNPPEEVLNMNKRKWKVYSKKRKGRPHKRMAATSS